jgi:hypothetical protein
MTGGNKAATIIGTSMASSIQVLMNVG